MLKILVLGDIMGKIGRRALEKKLPALRKKYKPDLVIANCENLAHGTGVTIKTLNEVVNAGVDFFTSGNHVWDKEEEFKKVLKEKGLSSKLVRPANYKKNLRKSGEGYKIIKVGNKKIAVINLMGIAFMKDESEKLRPAMKVFDEILKELENKKISAILVDMHAEATSEKRAFGWYADGKATVVWGTHTHIPTADAEILPNGTGYITDLGMTGGRDTVIGEEKEPIIESQRRGEWKIKHDIPEKGPAVIQGILVTIKNKKTIAIKQILEQTSIN